MSLSPSPGNPPPPLFPRDAARPRYPLLRARRGRPRVPRLGRRGDANTGPGTRPRLLSGACAGGGPSRTPAWAWSPVRGLSFDDSIDGRIVDGGASTCPSRGSVTVTWRESSVVPAAPLCRGSPFSWSTSSSPTTRPCPRDLGPCAWRTQGRSAETTASPASWSSPAAFAMPRKTPDNVGRRVRVVCCPSLPTAASSAPRRGAGARAGHGAVWVAGPPEEDSGTGRTARLHVQTADVGKVLLTELVQATVVASFVVLA